MSLHIFIVLLYNLFMLSTHYLTVITMEIWFWRHVTFLTLLRQHETRVLSLFTIVLLERAVFVVRSQLCTY